MKGGRRPATAAQGGEQILYLLGPFDVLGVERFVRVYVPEEGARGAPALFMFDGQNVFHDAPSFSGGWHVHESISAISPPPVVVAIDHGGDRRIHELSPFRSRET